jgi:uncharacterized repeat protein (TIGR01451 family)
MLVRCLEGIRHTCARRRVPVPLGLVLIGMVSLALCSRAVPVSAQAVVPGPCTGVAGPATLSLAGQGGLATPGSQTTYALRLLNWTDQPASGGVISYTLPAGITYVPGSTRVTAGGGTLSTTDPVAAGSTLAWGPFQVPAAGHTAHTPRGIHTAVQDLCLPEFIDVQLDQALALVGSGGYVTQLFYRITEQTTAPDACAVYFVNAAYDRNLVPILRLQGTLNPAGYWDKPAPGPRADYGPVATGFARYVAGLPRRDTHPLYIAVWNEPDLWIEWSNAPNATEYARFFVAVSGALRGLADSRIRILNGAMTPANTGFIRQMLAVPGFVGAFDAWASHCYPYNHPAWYNIHSGTARYGNATIDCYLLEHDAIEHYGGRSDFKFVLAETGHGLGDDVYDFEGYPAINEANRAAYVKDAVSRYWPAWPEVIAATPFLLGDPWNGWERFDWLDYDVHLSPPHFAFVPHPQYTAVAALSKPIGATVPHSIQVTFEAQAAAAVALGVHTGTLCGRAGDVTVPCTRTAAVRVIAHIEHTYLPHVGRGLDGGHDEGTWYQSEAGDAAEGRTTA